MVFICQYIPAWSKNKQLHEALKEDSRFETILLCIPNRVYANTLSNPEDMSNEVYDYFRDHGYQDAVNALTGINEWLDLKALHPDYVIYNRYDRPMPIEYTSSVVSEYAKVCLIIYGCALLKAEESMFDKRFAANTFCFFAESEGIKNEFISWNSLLCRLHLSNAYLCGIPAVENALKARNDITGSWDLSKNQFRAIYAPRWTLDPLWGGSSFLKYKDVILSIADRHPDLDLLLRPHPLMFNNFISKEIMREEEVEEFRQACENKKNVQLDKEKEYHAAFWNSDVLICDYSSMLIEYFVTEKPIIYLTYDESIQYTAEMTAMLSASYIVRNEEELESTLIKLMNGEDPKYSQRKEVCETVLNVKNNLSASSNMKQVLLDEYRM